MQYIPIIYRDMTYNMLIMCPWPWKCSLQKHWLARLHINTYLIVQLYDLIFNFWINVEQITDVRTNKNWYALHKVVGA